VCGGSGECSVSSAEWAAIEPGSNGSRLLEGELSVFGLFHSVHPGLQMASPYEIEHCHLFKITLTHGAKLAIVSIWLVFCGVDEADMFQKLTFRDARFLEQALRQ
jgi:hypothetical protein